MFQSEEAVRDAVLDYLREKVEPDVGEALAVTRIHSYPTCWVVGYNTVAYIETGALSHALVGGGPIIVNRISGSIRMGTSGLPTEDQLDLA